MTKTINDLLAEEIVSTINKDLVNSAFLLGRGGTPTDINEYVSTGSSLLDLIVSNRPHGGFPVGRISVITGLESTGKSLLAAHILAETQKKNGISILIDNETSYSTEFLDAIGVDTKKLIYIHLETVEDIFETIEKIIARIREEEVDRLVTIVVDSIAAASTKKEMEGTFDKEGYGMDKAYLLSKATRKLTQNIGKNRICCVFTNQLRMKIGITFGDPYCEPGGLAIPFHSSLTVRLKRISQVKVNDKVVGIRVKAQVTKSRIAPPLRTCSFNIYFNRGIDDLEGWFDQLVEFEHIVKPKRSQHCKLLIDENHELIDKIREEIEQNKDLFRDIKNDYVEFRNSNWANLIMKCPNIKEYAYSLLCKSLILEYKTDSNEEKIEETIDKVTEEIGDVV